MGVRACVCSLVCGGVNKHVLDAGEANHLFVLFRRVCDDLRAKARDLLTLRLLMAISTRIARCVSDYVMTAHC